MLRTAVARFALSSPDAAVRLDAVREMLRSLDEASIALLRERVGVETDAGVKAEIETGLALAALDGGDPEARLAAIATLSQPAPAGGAQPARRAARASRRTARFAESDDEVRRAAAAAVRSDRSARARSTRASRRCSSA